MSGSLARAAPMRFLIGVMLAWTIGRGVALAGWQPEAAAPVLAARAPAAAADRPLVRPAPTGDGASASMPVPPPRRRTALFDVAAPRPPIARAILPKRPVHAVPAAMPRPMLVAYAPVSDYRRSPGLVETGAIVPPRRATSRFSGSAWAFFRGGGRARLLSPGGQIGGGQAGARLLYTVDRTDRIAIAARVSRTIGGIRQAEAAVGVDWRPAAAIPVRLMLDRRIAIDRGGRNAWALGAAGGVDDVRIAPGWRLDGYGEAGVVGAHRRDLYADGAARIARAIDLGGGRSLAVGPGVWAAAQPGAARLDVGPSVVLRMPVAGHFVAAALDWRARVAGAAKPDSGVALTIATDF